jgi:hypothetical protein
MLMPMSALALALVVSVTVMSVFAPAFNTQPSICHPIYKQRQITQTAKTTKTNNCQL